MKRLIPGVAVSASLVLGAPAMAVDALNIDSAGNVGIGITTPTQSLHVQRDDASAQVLVEEVKAVAGPQTLFRLANPGNTKFEIENTDAANSWAFANSGTDFRISLQNSGVVEFKVNNAGDAFLAGVLNENSDRNAKTNIEAVDPAQVLDRVVSLPIAHWSYKDSPETRHIGPMAQDFRAAFGTGSSDASLATLDTSGVALAAIQALEHRNRELEDRVRQLEAMVSELLPRVSQR